eukprot:TRINITY_DN3593_c0_g1_i3.p1 TRINITY_DN3593_c0_g1~~TRINITY_DN3593_c0_g1_i3.p1  ORF type:complete len:298 (-),score=59.74 TRINITY_DN3593_c0_g1_i3:206-1099(-)
MLKAFCFVLLLVGACFAALLDANFNSPVDQSKQFSVVTTRYNDYYGNNGVSGACAVPNSATDTALVALPWDDKKSPFDFAFCGACYEVEGPSGKAVAKVFDWQESSLDTRWVLNGMNGGPYPSIGCTGGQCNIKAKLVPCPETQNIRLDFNEWNNGYYILVAPVFHKIAIYKVTLTDSKTTSPITLKHDQASYVLGDRQVVVPFTLTLYAVNGESVSVVVTGIPSAGTWPQGGNNLGRTVSYPTNVQFTGTYTGGQQQPSTAVNTLEQFGTFPNLQAGSASTLCFSFVLSFVAFLMI